MVGLHANVHWSRYQRVGQRNQKLRSAPTLWEALAVIKKHAEGMNVAIQKVSLRPARRRDYHFALQLYLASTKPLLISLGQWEERRVLDNFAANFKPSQVTIINSGSLNVGWFQVSKSEIGLHLDQLHLIEAAQNHGIGTSLICKLKSRAEKRRCPLELNVFRGNRAVNLYKRLGFKIIGEDESRLKMIWQQKRLLAAT
jgi:ribosomal protein S18 acetylase RimI-like enzyme